MENKAKVMKTFNTHTQERDIQDINTTTSSDF